MIQMINVLNRIEVSKLRILGQPTIIISVTDKSSDFADINITDSENLKSILRLRFGDLEDGEDGCISEAEANEIVTFINKHKDKAENLIINCDGGISRSSAIAAATAIYLGLDDMFIWGNGRYCPNMTVYNKLTAIMFKDKQAPSVLEKEELNIRLWNKRMGI